MKNFDQVVAFLKEKGFVYSSSQIYGGLANTWDYGPLGSLLKDNIKNYWKDFFIFKMENSFLFDSPILLNNKVWEASGHFKKFNDPVIICINNNKVYRADKLILEYTKYNPAKLSEKEIEKIIKNEIFLEEYGKDTKWSEIQSFNLMFKVVNSKQKLNDFLHLRPETAQGIFIAFKNIVDTINPKLPFAVGQIGKSFRNEVTPGNFIFRTKEFEQLELEYFILPNENEIYFNKLEQATKLFLKNLSISDDNLIYKKVDKEDLAHYSKKTIDVEYRFPFGIDEVLGLADRGDFDLKTHYQHSNADLSIGIINPETNKIEKIIPNVIELSIGVERLMLVIILENLTYTEDNSGKKREILKLPYHLAPYKLAIAPLTNKLNQEAKEIYKDLLNKDFGGPITFISGGSIGKRYYKQDAIGTPYVITYDFDSLHDNMVTIRNRDNQEQERIKINEIEIYIKNNGK